MTKRNMFFCLGIGLLLLVVLASSPGAQARMSSFGRQVGHESALPQRTWTFQGWVYEGDEPPAIGIEKVRLTQDPEAPVVVGDTVIFSVTARNTGTVPLHDVVVQDMYEPECLILIDASGMPTQVSPGLLRWEIPSLAAGDALVWEVIFEVKSACDPVDNCVTADAEGPAGEPVHDEACAEFRTVPPEPGLVVRKQLAGNGGLPVPGDIMRFEIQAQNVGNKMLQVVRVEDHYDVGCLEYVSAMPEPDGVNPAIGDMWWDNIGPLGPGQDWILSVFLLLDEPCERFGNCAQAFWMVDGEPRLDASDCVEMGIHPPSRPIYFPLLMKQYPIPGPTATPTQTRALGPPTNTPPPFHTPTATSEQSPTPTATLPARTLIFVDDFNSGALTGWTANRGAWTNPGTYMQGVYTLGGAWNIKTVSGSDFIYEGVVTLRSGNAAGLTFRSNGDGTQSYDLLMDYVDQEVKLSKRSPYEKMVGARRQGMVEYDRAYRLKVMVQGNQLQGYLDDRLLVTATDNTFSSGWFGVTVFRATAEFDDLSARTSP